MNKNLKIQFSEYLFHIGLFYLYLFAVILLFSSTVFLFGGKMSPLTFPICFVVSGMLLYFFEENRAQNKSILFLLEIITAAVGLLVAFMICGSVYDGTWDGNGYHKLAVGLLRDGWNPVWQLPQDAIPEQIVPFGAEVPGAIWAEAYCKATWIFGASVYFITGNIECGKSYTLIAIFCAFSISYRYLRLKGKSRHLTIIFSLIAAFNPVAVAQYDTYYVDGFLHIILYILIFSLIASIDDLHSISPTTVAGMIAASMIVCSNIKFTGLLYGGIYCIVYFIWYCVCQWREKAAGWKRHCIRRFILFAILAMICVAWAGSSSYITNWFRHGTFTYPLTGENAVDIMTANSPFFEANHIQNLFLSLFSRMDSFSAVYTPEYSPLLKFPFSFNWEYEKDFLKHVDCRISGFGLLFSGVFIISIMAIFLYGIYTKEKKEFHFLIMNIGISLLLCLIISESWWARYSPYIYFIPLMGIYCLLGSKNHYFQKIGAFVGLLLLFNNCLFLCDLQDNILQAKTISCNLTSISDCKKILINYGNFPGICYNLQDAKIQYQSDPSLLDGNYLDYMFAIWKEV